MTLQATKTPKHLGKYEVGAKIGGGGMATVFVGHAPREEGGDEELVALKVIRDELAGDEQFAHMFIDEAKILARLSHPNVIHTLEYGVTGHHRFIAMELLSGRTYADVWDLLVEKKEAMPLRLGAWVCARVAEGLHSAHELLDEDGHPLHVIHRDVNPTNIFLTHSGEVKLIDFGLAKARVRVSKSADGIVKGKIPYLAPEQAQGKPIDRRIDVYALGTTLWETSTMKRLFKRDTDVDTLLAIRDAKVPDVRQMIEGFPDALWAIIAKALKIDANERFQTAKEMKDALDAFVGDGFDMQGELASLIARLFPGQEAKQAKWMRDATNVRITQGTMPPPAPVPIASSTLLEDVESGPLPPASPSEPSPRPSPKRLDETPEESISTLPRSRRPNAISSRPPEAVEILDPALPKAKKAEKAEKKPKKRKGSKKQDKIAPTEAPNERKIWIWVAAALIVAAVLYWALAR